MGLVLHGFAFASEFRQQCRRWYRLFKCVFPLKAGLPLRFRLETLLELRGPLTDRGKTGEPGVRGEENVVHPTRGRGGVGRDGATG